MPRLSKYLTNNGIAFVSCNCRMYHEAVFPDFVRDAAYAVAWAKNNIHNYGKITKIFIG